MCLRLTRSSPGHDSGKIPRQQREQDVPGERGRARVLQRGPVEFVARARVGARAAGEPRRRRRVRTDTPTSARSIRWRPPRSRHARASPANAARARGRPDAPRGAARRSAGRGTRRTCRARSSHGLNSAPHRRGPRGTQPRRGARGGGARARGRARDARSARASPRAATGAGRAAIAARGAGRTDPPPSEGRGETRHVVETCFCARPHCDGWLGSGRGIGKKKTRPVPLVWFRACTATETARSTRRGDREESKDDWVVHRRTNGICGRCFYADGVRVRAHANDRGDRSSFSSRSRRFPVCF